MKAKFYKDENNFIEIFNFSNIVFTKGEINRTSVRIEGAGSDKVEDFIINTEYKIEVVDDSDNILNTKTNMKYAGFSIDFREKEEGVTNSIIITTVLNFVVV